MAKPKRVFDHLRSHLELAAGIWPEFPPRLTLAQLEAEWSVQFEKLMKNRILMGTLRYGRMSMRRFNQLHYNNCDDAVRRIRLYQATGNAEHLVDAANMLLVEFEVGVHPNKHFSQSDDGEHAIRSGSGI